MKTMKYFLSMAALALVGAMTVSCSSDNDITAQPQQPETKNNLVTLTTTVSLGGDHATRALTIDGNTGVKTFAVGETMAIYYWKNKGNDHEKAVSAPLTAGDITNGGKSATFTFTLDNPYKDMGVVYTYPAAMANADFSPNYDALYNNQDGTLATLASDFDFCTGSRAWNGDNLPSLTLENQLAILAITLKNEDGSSDITSSTTKLTVSDGTNTYNVNRSAAEGPIYVAIRPTTSATINIEAISSSQGYCKTLTPKTYAASNGYPVSWKMTPATLLSTISSDYMAQNGETLYGKLGSNVNISIADDATVILDNVTIIGTKDDLYVWGGINCEGNAKIILKGTNTLKGFYYDYPGIYVPDGCTLTIEGTGSLNASSNGSGAGIGGVRGLNCGNIIINGGTITATGGNFAAGIGGGGEGSCCGDITINGGTITAYGGDNGAGIGSGGNSEEWINENSGETSCGNITINGGTITAEGGCDAAGIGSGCYGYCSEVIIKNTVTRVTATKGLNAPHAIGLGSNGNCAKVTIDDTDGYITEEQYTYEPK